MENVVARSEAFCSQLLPILREYASQVYGSVSERDLYLAFCRSQPSLIRTEADELTYPLHILVRYEVERALFSGDVSVHDAPDYWNDRMRAHLGVEVPDDAHGILQDTHWAGGTFAYFPSYAIGSAYAAQYLHAMEGEFDVFGAIAQGNLAPIRHWLGGRVWRHGSAKDPAQVVADACGAPFDASHYVEYLTKKYRAIYNV